MTGGRAAWMLPEPETPPEQHLGALCKWQWASTSEKGKMTSWEAWAARRQSWVGLWGPGGREGGQGGLGAEGWGTAVQPAGRKAERRAQVSALAANRA